MALMETKIMEKKLCYRIFRRYTKDPTIDNLSQLNISSILSQIWISCPPSLPSPLISCHIVNSQDLKNDKHNNANINQRAIFVNTIKKDKEVY